ncbi:MAG TPA: radical SAM protein [Candidatus Ozemobacteraceae bacterium]|nr:radical SAM protein [Candidatus Ozemobacteraceae bacterium]HQG27658.1 radical SAM protein [Candidatus Ozemobacteraceae bacterium]
MDTATKTTGTWDFRADVVAAEFGSFRCNYACSFCHKDYFFQQNPSGRGRKTLAEGIALCQSLLKGDFSVHLAGSGEPLLLSPDALRRQVEPIRAMGACRKIKLTTNGFFLAERAAMLGDLGIGSISVSLPTLDPASYSRCMGVTQKSAMERISRTMNGISTARSAGLKVDLNVCAAEDLLPQLDAYIDLSRTHGVKIKFFPLLQVPGKGSSSASPHFGNLLRELNRRASPVIDKASRYTSILWDVDGASISAKPGDPFSRPTACYECPEYSICEESCWRSIRVSPWYIQPCGVKTSNIYFHDENSPATLARKLAVGGKLPTVCIDSDERAQGVNAAMADAMGRRKPFIVLEGPDGSGKSTAIPEIAKHLGYIPYATPPEGFRDQAFRAVFERPGLEYARYLYYMAGNAAADAELKTLLLHSGIVCDRWLMSTFLYHGLVMGCDTALPASFVNGLISPDLTIVLDVSPETQKHRISQRRPTHDAAWETSDRIRKTIARAYREQRGPGIVHVSADGPVSEVVERCLEAIYRHVNAAERTTYA